MRAESADYARMRPLLERVVRGDVRDLILEREPLHGGLGGCRVILVTARFNRRNGTSAVLRLVVKTLRGEAVREALAYERLAVLAGTMAPRVLAIVRNTNSTELYIQALRRISAWPWSQLSHSWTMMRRLAEFHAAAADQAPELPPWDEQALRSSAETTLLKLEECRFREDMAFLARGVPALRRLVLAQPSLRNQLVQAPPLGCGPLHGDLHPGNVLLCRRSGSQEPVMVDWERARLGSPLEDLASWLHSLQHLVPEVKHRHDSLIKSYLFARGMEPKLTTEFRVAYWLACASNALSGALLHHLVLALDNSLSPTRRTAAIRAARDWIRVVRRADECWT